MKVAVCRAAAQCL